jgi:hypothetical protein
VSGRGPLSVGWIFPPDIPRWVGLTDLTLGWYQDARGIDVSELGHAALENYFEALSAFGGELRPDSGVIRGWSFRPTATTAYAEELAQIIRTGWSSYARVDIEQQDHPQTVDPTSPDEAAYRLPLGLHADCVVGASRSLSSSGHCPARRTRAARARQPEHAPSGSERCPSSR